MTNTVFDSEALDQARAWHRLPCQIDASSGIGIRIPFTSRYIKIRTNSSRSCRFQAKFSILVNCSDHGTGSFNVCTYHRDIMVNAEDTERSLIQCQGGAPLTIVAIAPL
jgi:hypothetical protein